MVEDEETKQAETSGGYAKEMSDAYKQKQATLIADTIKKQDIVICTALIPGRAAPRLVTEAMIQSMRSGSILVDLAVEQGGNIAYSEPGKIVDVGGVRILGHRNVPSRLPVDASNLYAKNILNYLTLIAAKEGGVLQVPWDDDIVKAITLTRDGRIQLAQFQ
jgi:H+-translocating NAD(P) transhydrogenase subunit alpha